jgi:hypothetical protein
VVVQLRLRLVVHLLDPGRVDATVLDQLRQRDLRDLPPDAVERRQHHGPGRVVDDDVDPGQVLESPDVPPLAADDPALHVVRRQLDERDGGLGRVAGGDPLERVGDEIACPPARFGLRLLLHLTDTPGQLVADELLRALEHLGAGFVDRHPREALELGELLLLGRLELLLKLARVHLTVGDPLFPAVELDDLPLELPVLRGQPLLHPQRLRLTGVDVALELLPEPHGLLLRLQLGLAAERLGLAAGLLEQELALSPGGRKP